MFKLGKSIKCRVLTVDVKRRRVLLTRKPTLIKSKLPALATYPARDSLPSTEAAAIGSIVEGFVTAIRPAGLIVTFYNNVHGIVPEADLAKQVRDLPESHACLY